MMMDKHRHSDDHVRHPRLPVPNPSSWRHVIIGDWDWDWHEDGLGFLLRFLLLYLTFSSNWDGAAIVLDSLRYAQVAAESWFLACSATLYARS